MITMIRKKPNTDLGKLSQRCDINKNCIKKFLRKRQLIIVICYLEFVICYFRSLS
jgi:hypothetical protein